MQSVVGQQQLLTGADQTDGPLEILKQEKSRLENAVVHLKVSLPCQDTHSPLKSSEVLIELGE